MSMDEAICRPFLDFEDLLHADRLQYFTDGALNPFRLGVGGSFGSEWFYGSQDVDSLGTEGERLNIQIVELYAILLREQRRSRCVNYRV